MEQNETLPRTEGHKVLTKLERGKRYRVRHRAGKRIVTHEGLMVEPYHGEFRLQTKVLRTPPQPMRPYLRDRTIRIYPDEIVSVDEIQWDFLAGPNVPHYKRIGPES